MTPEQIQVERDRLLMRMRPEELPAFFAEVLRLAGMPYDVVLRRHVETMRYALRPGVRDQCDYCRRSYGGHNSGCPLGLALTATTASQAKHGVKR